ncbi:hypothetical protein B0I37DRAFT_191562 [Chaetomium sp. MPI-CAGE-AT-0009]|nr:hypothetical protein B0I37DRAFT_191562 [Chaetomium sp. MPI-CAGE-AT-0009]
MAGCHGFPTAKCNTTETARETTHNSHEGYGAFTLPSRLAQRRRQEQWDQHNATTNNNIGPSPRRVSIGSGGDACFSPCRSGATTLRHHQPEEGPNGSFLVRGLAYRCTHNQNPTLKTQPLRLGESANILRCDRDKLVEGEPNFNMVTPTSSASNCWSQARGSTSQTQPHSKHLIVIELFCLTCLTSQRPLTSPNHALFSPPSHSPPRPPRVCQSKHNISLVPPKSTNQARIPPPRLQRARQEHSILSHPAKAREAARR